MRVAKLYKDAVLSSRKHVEDAGVDLYAYCEEDDYVLGFGDIAIIPTGVTVEIPKNCAGFIWPKSRNNYLIGGGVIDSEYQGEILVKVMNVQNSEITIRDGDAIAQLIITPVIITPVVEVGLDEIHQKKSLRGNTGGIVTQVNHVAD